LRRISKEGALPLPVCGERGGVRGKWISDNMPLTRLAMLADLSP